MKLNTWNLIFNITFSLHGTNARMHARMHARTHTELGAAAAAAAAGPLIPLLTMNNIFVIWGIGELKQPFEDYSQISVKGGQRMKDGGPG